MTGAIPLVSGNFRLVDFKHMLNSKIAGASLEEISAPPFQVIQTEEILRFRYVTDDQSNPPKQVEIEALFGRNPGQTTPAIGFFQTNSPMSFYVVSGWIYFTSRGANAAIDWEPAQTSAISIGADGTGGILQVDGATHRAYLFKKHSGASQVRPRLVSNKTCFKTIDTERWFSETLTSGTCPITDPQVVTNLTPQKDLLDLVDAALTAAGMQP